MTLAIILNLVFVIVLLTLLGATMRLPFMLRSGDHVQAKTRRRRVEQARRTAPGRPALRDSQGVLASD